MYKWMWKWMAWLQKLANLSLYPWPVNSNVRHTEKNTGWKPGRKLESWSHARCRKEMSAGGTNCQREETMEAGWRRDRRGEKGTVVPLCVGMFQEPILPRKLSERVFLGQVPELSLQSLNREHGVLEQPELGTARRAQASSIACGSHRPRLRQPLWSCSLILRKRSPRAYSGLPESCQGHNWRSWVS